MGESKMAYQAAFDIEDASEIKYLQSVIREGTDLFEKLMDYRVYFLFQPMDLSIFLLNLR